MRKGLVGGISLAVIIAVVISVLMNLTVQIPAGYAGVCYKVSGGVADETLSQGWHIVSPTTHVTKYTVGMEQSYLTAGKVGDSRDDESYSVSSKEGKAVTVEAAFSYQYDQSELKEIFTTFKGQSGTEIRDSFIKPNFIKWSKEVLARYSVSEMLGSERAEINDAVQNYVAEKFEPYGIIITNAGISNYTVDEATANAIAEKINAQQEQETAKIQNETNKEKAEADKAVAITNAEAEAEQKKIEAQAEADAIAIKAAAEAEANKEIAASLTPELIEKIKYEQWNGELPMVEGGSTPIIDLTEDSTEE